MLNVLRRPLSLALALLISGAYPAFAQDIEALGGDMTSDLTNQNAIQAPAPNISSEERRLQQVNGFVVFHLDFLKNTGLGPFFNNRSCGGCHINNGRGPIRISKKPGGTTTMVLKISRKGLKSDGSPRNVPGLGEQVRDHVLGGLNERASISLRWRYRNRKYPDGTPYQLREPLISVSVPGMDSKKLVTSLRMTPPVIGPGLLEAIPDEQLLANEDPEDADADGISGEAQYVRNVETQSTAIGRFGFRASHPTVAQQSAAAAFHDIGVTSSLFPPRSGTPELSDTDLQNLVIYLELGGVPRARNQTDPDVVAGKALFQQVGCDDCHRFGYTTSPDADPEIRDQIVHPFTDLLLHDMGKGLSDRRPEHNASGREWKTTFLWGLGFTPNISNVRRRYLHDGRARSIEEAILWHGGEAEASKQAFMQLSKEEREKLLAFLRSI